MVSLCFFSLSSAFACLLGFIQLPNLQLQPNLVELKLMLHLECRINRPAFRFEV